MAKHVQDSNLEHMRSSQVQCGQIFGGVRKVIYLKLLKNEVTNFPGKRMELEDVILTGSNPDTGREMSRVLSY